MSPPSARQPGNEVHDVDADIIDRSAVKTLFEIPRGAALQTQRMLRKNRDGTDFPEETGADDFAQLAHDRGIAEVELAADGELLFLGERLDALPFGHARAEGLVGNDVLPFFQRTDAGGSAMGIDVANCHDVRIGFGKHPLQIIVRDRNSPSRREQVARRGIHFAGGHNFAAGMILDPFPEAENMRVAKADESEPVVHAGFSDFPVFDDR